MKFIRNGVLQQEIAVSGRITGKQCDSIILDFHDIEALRGCPPEMIDNVLSNLLTRFTPESTICGKK